MDVIVADLDGGCVSVPESCVIPQLPEPARSLALHSLSQVLHPELHRSDFAFPTPVRPSPPLVRQWSWGRGCWRRWSVVGLGTGGLFRGLHCASVVV